MKSRKDEVVPTSTVDARIVVVGVGGAGANAVDNMIESGLSGVEFIACNTDAQALKRSKAPMRIQLGGKVTGGLGAGADPSVGHEAAEESIDEIVTAVGDANMVFVTAGMGGGTGTGASPLIASRITQKGILTVGVVTKPFRFEGNARMQIAEGGIRELAGCVDTLIVIPNQNLFRISNERTTFRDAFRMADEVLYAGVRGITDVIVMPGIVNLDFNDVRTILLERGAAMMGIGEGEGDGRAIAAAEAAISNPLLESSSVRGATGVLISIAGGLDMTLHESDEASSRIIEEIGDSAKIIFGASFDESLSGKVRICVIASGIDPALSIAETEPTHNPHRVSSGSRAGVARSAQTEGQTVPVQKDDPQVRRVQATPQHRSQQQVGGFEKLHSSVPSGDAAGRKFAPAPGSLAASLSGGEVPAGPASGTQGGGAGLAGNPPARTPEFHPNTQGDQFNPQAGIQGGCRATPTAPQAPQVPQSQQGSHGKQTGQGKDSSTGPFGASASDAPWRASGQVNPQAIRSAIATRQTSVRGRPISQPSLNEGEGIRFPDQPYSQSQQQADSSHPQAHDSRKNDPSFRDPNQSDGKETHQGEHFIPPAPEVMDDDEPAGGSGILRSLFSRNDASRRNQRSGGGSSGDVNNALGATDHESNGRDHVGGADASVGVRVSGFGSEEDQAQAMRASNQNVASFGPERTRAELAGVAYPVMGGGSAVMGRDLCPPRGLAVANGDFQPSMDQEFEPTNNPVRNPFAGVQPLVEEAEPSVGEVVDEDSAVIVHTSRLPGRSQVRSPGGESHGGLARMHQGQEPGDVLEIPSFLRRQRS